MQRFLFSLLAAFAFTFGAVHAQTITITTPNGGENLDGCVTHTITWTASGTSNNYSIDYSIDNGANWTSVASFYFSTAGTFAWEVPNVSSANCLVRVYDSNSPATVDVSDAVFSINGPLILQSPNGGENWTANTTQTISWLASGTSNIYHLEYTTDNGATWTTIVNNHNAPSGTYNWSVPNLNSTQAQVRITDVNNAPCMSDKSNLNFNIVSVINVTAPNGGENLTASVGPSGGTWLMNNSTDVIANTGNFYDSGGPNGNYGSYQNYTKTFYPDNPTLKAQFEFAEFQTYNSSDYLQIYDGPSTSSPLIGTYSGTNSPGTVTSTSKEGALTFRWITNNSGTQSGWKAFMSCLGGNTTPITFGYTGTSGEFDIEYSTNGGVSWNRIVSEYPSLTGIYNWPIPNHTTSSAKVRVVDAANGDIVDESNANFTINAAAPEILLCSPLGGESWFAGTVHSITWRSAFLSGPNVNLEYSTDNGSTWTTIVTNTQNDGDYSWSVPNDASTTALVRVSESGNPAVNDQSDNVFTIRPHIDIVQPNGGEVLAGCDSYTIGWYQGGTSNRFDIDLSTDGGTTWSGIVTNLYKPSSYNTYTWTVNNVNSSNCRIRIKDTNAPSKRDSSSTAFTINSTSNVTVDQPNGGETWVAGGTFPIVYTIGHPLTNVRIEYSIDSGATWSTIVSSTNGGVYNWTIPNIYSDEALIRITDIANPCNQDVSNAVFDILSEVEVLVPNGGETYMATGGPNGGNWNLSNSTDVTMTSGNFYDSGGPNGSYGSYQNYTKTFYPYNPSAKLEVEFYEFRTYNSSDYLRIYDGPSTSSPLIGTFSSTNIPPKIRSTSKEGALTFYWVSNNSGTQSGWVASLTSVSPGNPVISWEVTGTSGEFSMDYSTDGGTTWIDIVDEVHAADTGRFSWPVPNNVTTNGRVRVFDINKTDIIDISDNNFSITAASPVYQLCVPNGGETWYAGEIKTLEWRSAFTSSPFVSLELSTDNGATWSFIENSTVNDGEFDWVVTNTPSTQCLVRVTDTGNPANVDQSDAVFEIRPYISVMAPNGGQTLVGCTNYNIQWEAGGTSDRYDLAYSTDGGTTWTNIAVNQSRTTTISSYNWNVPNISTTQARIRIMDTNDGTKVDMSDADFTILPTANVQVISPNGGNNVIAGLPYPINYILQGGVTNVRIEYSLDSGVTWATVTSNSSGGTYNWNVPNVFSDEALIRVTDVSSTCSFDVSDAVFNILSEVTVTAPNGGETVTASGGPNGGTFNMSNSPITTVTTANFYDPGGRNGNYGTYENYTRTFQPYNPESKLQVNFHEFDTYNSSDYLRIYDGPSTSSPYLGQYSSSNSPGVITSTHKSGALTFVWVSNNSGTRFGWEATMTCVHPNNQTIAWNTVGTSGSFDLEYSNNNGLNWVRIVSDYKDPSNTFSWPAPAQPTTTALVRVLDAGNGNIVDVSDSNFTIVGTDPVYLLCVPNDGEVWYAGETMEIQWLSAFTSNPYVELEYTTDNGATWTTITGTTFNDGSYDWLVPNAPSDLCKVRVSDNSNSTYFDQSDSTFTIRPYITVLTPNGGESLTGCTNYNLTWENGGTSDRFDLEYSTDGGSTWTTIVTNLNQTARISSYSWTVPNVISSQVMVRVTDTNDPLKTDVSDAVFSVNPTLNVQVASPNGGESFLGGLVYPITYTLSGGVTNVRLQYSLDSGATWATITSNTSSGSYNWSVPNIPSTQALIRATDISNSCNFDVSDAVFNVVTEVTVLDPNGGETVVASGGQNGGNYNMQTASVTTITTANFYDPGGKNGNYGTYQNYTRTFQPFNPDAKLQVTFHEFRTYNSSDYLRIYDGPSTSSPYLGQFSSTNNPGTITSTAKGGELTFIWVSNNSGTQSGWEATFTSVHPDNETISWSNTGTSGEFDLEYSTNNGTIWTRIISDYQSPTNTFSWPAPATPSTTALVRVLDASNGMVADVSDSVFTITGTDPVYLICSANGGETWYGGETRTIEWRSAFATNPYVKIDYSVDSGATWVTAVGSTLNDGSYDWIVPNLPSTTTLLRVLDASNPIYGDTSDAVFTLEPWIRVQNPNGGENITGCTNYTLRWINGGTSDRFDLDYSTDGGATWVAIATNYLQTSLNATYNWTAPNLISNQCLIRVTDTNDPFKTDVSDAVFNISPSTNVSLIQPNGGENWVAGAIYPVIYTLGGGVTNVRIEYSTNGGTTWATVVSNTSNTTYNWTIPNVSTNQALVRVTDVSNPCNFNQSAAVFNMLSEISVNNPNGGDTVRASGGLIQGSTYLMNTTATNSITTGSFYDSGGANGSYGTYQNYTRTFMPENPTHKLRVEFTEFRTYNSSDYLSIYDGPSTSSAYLIGTYSSTNIPPTITSSHKTGALTFRWISNNSGQQSGWKGFFSSIGPDNMSIDWSTIGTSGEFDIQYSINNGSSWNTIITDYESSLGHFDWAAPNLPTNQALIRVVDAGNSSILDQSDATFTILAGVPQVVVCAPNGGEQWYAGNNYTIEWGSIYLSSGSVKLEYSTDNGATWNTIVGATPDDGTQTWTVPGTPSTTALVRVSDFGNAANFDQSDTTFTIRPYIEVNTPNGGEITSGCNGYNITWYQGGTSDRVDIDYSTDGGTTWTSIVSNLLKSSSFNSYTWTVPNFSSTTAKIRISDTNDPLKTDESDAVFSMNPTSDVTINSPNGGEFWVAGTQQNIVYTMLNGTTNIRLEYSLDSGATWQTITTNTSTGSYLWTIPNTPSDLCLIRGRDISNSCRFDVSDAVFSIISEVQVNSPNGGEIWQGQVGTPGGIFTMNNTTTVYCNSGNFFDSGGENGNYSTYQSYTKTFYPDVSTNKLKFYFTDFQTSTSSHYLRIYDGPSTSSPLIGSYSGSNSPGIITSSHPTGALTFRWSTGSGSTNRGWEAYISSTGSPTQNVTWNTTGTSGGVSIEYSTNGGLTWTRIVDEVPANAGSYAWMVPNTPSTSCLVRVLDDANNNIADESDNFFEITPGNPQLVTPNGGENAYSGVPFEIKWDEPTFLSTNVQLEYSLDNGVSWNLIVAFTFNDGTYSWIPPQTTNAIPNCLIRISESGNTIVNDISDNVFTLNPAIRITSPNGNAGNWRGCTQSTISWVAGASSNYLIELSLDSGSTWNTVESNYVNNNSVVNYNWAIPNTPSEKCLVRVTDVNNLSRTDVSDSVFTITPTITITQPTFGGQLQVGSVYPITWTSNVVSNFYDIDFSTNGGATWTNIVTNHFTTTDSYNWTVPNSVSTNCKVRVRDNLNTCKEDESDYAFTIQPAAPALTLTNPNGGDTLIGCSVYNITWTELTTSNFYTIEYSEDGGASWNTITSNYFTTSGTYAWTVPNINTSNGLIRITDSADPSKTDVSDQIFEIEQSVTVNITASSATTICVGDTVFLTSSSPTGNVWSPFGQTTQTIAVPQSGSYSVAVTNAGCVAQSQPVSVTVNPLPAVPTIMANGSTTICAGDNVILTSSSPSGNTWSPTGQTTQDIAVNTSGSYSVTVANQYGCSETSSPVFVTVTPLPATPTAGSNSPVSIGSSINLNATTVSGATYTWSGPNGFTSTQQNPTIPNATVAMSGTYTVVADVNGCQSNAGSVFVTVVPNSGIVNLAGRIESELGSPVRSVTVRLSGQAIDSVTTPLNGEYDFDVANGQSYVLTPEKYNDTITNNGITTLDLILMRRHILNADTLSSPYKILAADVNFSGGVSTLDLILTRTVILQTNLTFPNGALWTFVDSDFNFANSLSPWPYNDFRSIPVASPSIGLDFIGVKLGDVNNSWDPNTARIPWAGEVGLEIGDFEAAPGEEVVVPVRVHDFKSVSGYQFTMQWNPAALEYVGVENGMLQGFFGEDKVAQGMLATSWDDEMAGAIELEDGSVLFELRFRVKEDLEKDAMIYVSSNMARAEAYTDDLKLLTFRSAPGHVKVLDQAIGAQSAVEEGYALGMSYPNPFSESTEVSFRLPETTEVQFAIYDVNGQEVRRFVERYQAGDHTLEWDGTDQEGRKLSAGVYYLRMIAPEFTATRKMVFIRE